MNATSWISRNVSRLFPMDRRGLPATDGAGRAQAGRSQSTGGSGGQAAERPTRERLAASRRHKE